MREISKKHFSLTHEKLKQADKQTIAAALGALPVTRIKKIMRQESCQEARMIGRDATVSMTFAAQLFIGWCTELAWSECVHPLGHNTLMLKDLLEVCERNRQLAFLQDVTRSFLDEDMPPDAEDIGLVLQPSTDRVSIFSKNLMSANGRLGHLSMQEPPCNPPILKPSLPPIIEPTDAPASELTSVPNSEPALPIGA